MSHNIIGFFIVCTNILHLPRSLSRYFIARALFLRASTSFRITPFIAFRPPPSPPSLLSSVRETAGIPAETLRLCASLVVKIMIISVITAAFRGISPSPSSVFRVEHGTPRLGAWKRQKWISATGIKGLGPSFPLSRLFSSMQHKFLFSLLSCKRHSYSRSIIRKLSSSVYVERLDVYVITTLRICNLSIKPRVDVKKSYLLPRANKTNLIANMQ